MEENTLKIKYNGREKRVYAVNCGEQSMDHTFRLEVLSTTL